MELGITDRRVLVTGASGGLGPEVARAFAAEGARLVLVARDESRLREAAAYAGGEADVVVADLEERGTPARVAQRVLADAPVDVVVHCVGGTLDVREPLAPPDDWERVWRLNAGIAIELNHVLLPPMRERGWGRAIHISSTAADHLRGSPSYGPAKAFLNAYVRTVGRAVAEDGVVVTAISPGPFVSPGNNWERRSREEPEVLADHLARHEPLGRLTKAAEIAPFVVFLASDHGLLAAGEILPVSAGST